MEKPKYVWSETYGRIYKVAGKVSFELDDNGTIMVDVDGNLLNFKNLKYENTTPYTPSNDFDYKKYAEIIEKD